MASRSSTVPSLPQLKSTQPIFFQEDNGVLVKIIPDLDVDKEYHGYGLKSIRHAVQKYGGYINVHGEGHWFRLEMIIPLKTGI